MSYVPEHYAHNKNRICLHLSNYATKSNLKKAAFRNSDD